MFIFPFRVCASNASLTISCLAARQQERPPSLLEALKGLIEPRLHELGTSLHTGLHGTVPFFHIETEPFLRKLEKERVLSLDMELAVLFALANHHGKTTTGIISG
jgi:purine-nucleoside phosphorylase